MARIVQPVAVRGSQRWLQFIIKDHPAVLDRVLIPRLGLAEGELIDWRSPLREDSYAEYRDKAFLDRLGVSLSRRSLADFWPKLGPAWDGLGVTTRGDLLLVEVKSHII